MRSGKNGYFFQSWKDMAILTVKWWVSGSFTSVSTPSLTINWPLNCFHPPPPQNKEQPEAEESGYELAPSQYRLASTVSAPPLELVTSFVTFCVVRRWLGWAPVNLRSWYMQPPRLYKAQNAPVARSFTQYKQPSTSEKSAVFRAQSTSMISTGCVAYISHCVHWQFCLS